MENRQAFLNPIYSEISFVFIVDQINILLDLVDNFLSKSRINWLFFCFSELIIFSKVLNLFSLFFNKLEIIFNFYSLCSFFLFFY